MTTANLICKNHRLVSAWLVLCLLLVALMVLVGGYTRLSGSGLSITEWKPIHGVIPPVGSEEWEEEFTAYKATPQYEKINKGMTLTEFKAIFWPEYWHRVLGRLIGLVFLLPLIFFAVTKTIPRRLTLRLLAIFALGGLQGLMGWVMVASGLVDNPYVSHIKLALHLSLAFLLFALILWALLGIRSTTARGKPPASYNLWFILLCVQIVLGALLAGLHGGLVYNTWPDMNGQWIPDGLFNPNQLFIENITLIQFLHRKVALLVAGGFLFWWYYHRNYVKNKGLGKVCAGVTAIIMVQFALGVLTLLHHVPLPLALAHQMTGLLLFMLSVVLLHGLRHEQ